jgi:hypothetical protein
MKARKPRTGYQLARDRTTAALKREAAAHRRAEFKLHCNIIEVLERLHKPGVIWWHTPNEGKFTPKQMAHRRDMGVRPGVADIIVSMPGEKMIFFEVKTFLGPVSDKQYEFLDAMMKNGHGTWIIREVEHAIRLLTSHGAIHSSKVMA